MPELGTAFSIKNMDHKLTHEELVRGIRLLVAAEYEAVQIYEHVAGATDDEYAKAVIKDVIREERVHAGQFLELLKRLQPDEEALYEEGAKENRGLGKKGK